MTLREKQSLFVKNVYRLIKYAYACGFELTFGEASRPQSQVLLNYYGYDVVEKNGELSLVKTSPKSKTLKSLHAEKLAIDFNIFYNGHLLFWDKKILVDDLKLAQKLGNFWMTLHTDNRWGGDWNRNYNVLDETFQDPYHFEMKP